MYTLCTGGMDRSPAHRRLHMDGPQPLHSHAHYAGEMLDHTACPPKEPKSMPFTMTQRCVLKCSCSCHTNTHVTLFSLSNFAHRQHWGARSHYPPAGAHRQIATCPSRVARKWKRFGSANAPRSPKVPLAGPGAPQRLQETGLVRPPQGGNKQMSSAHS